MSGAFLSPSGWWLQTGDVLDTPVRQAGRAGAWADATSPS